MNVTHNVRSFGAKGDGVTDDTTKIQAAIDALPTAGGVVYFSPGTYLISTTLSLPTGKDVILRGSGLNSIIDLGSAAISAITLPDGVAATRQYVVEDLRVKGNETVGQELLRHNDDSGLDHVTFRRVRVDGLETILNYAAYDQTYLYPAQASFEECLLVPTTLATSTLIKCVNPGGTFAGAIVVRLSYTDCTGYFYYGSNKYWIIDFDGDLHLESSHLPIKPGGKMDGLGLNNSDASINGPAPGDVEVNAWAWWTTTIANSWLDRSASAAGSRWVFKTPQEISNCFFYGKVKFEAERSGLSYCHFYGPDTGAVIEFAAAAPYGHVSDGSFLTFGLAATKWITTAAADGVFSGNIFAGAITPLEETGAANGNLLEGNLGLDLGGGPIIIGAGTRVDGARAGVSALVAEAAFKIAAIFAAVGNVGVGEDDLQTFNVPANCLAKDGAVVEIEASGTLANNANAKTVKLHFGGTAIITVTAPVSVAVSWAIYARIVRTGVDTQKYSVEFVTTGAAGVSFITTASGTLTKDDGAAIIVKTTGEAGANDDIVSELLVGKGYN